MQLHVKTYLDETASLEDSVDMKHSQYTAK